MVSQIVCAQNGAKSSGSAVSTPPQLAPPAATNVNCITLSKPSAIAAAANFDFLKSDADMADLMRRVYDIRFQCGVVEDDAAKKMQQQQQQRFDAFEQKKVDTGKLILELKRLVDPKTKHPSNVFVRNQLRQKLPVLEEFLLELQELQQRMRGRLGPWQEKPCDKTLVMKREQDIQLIEQHIVELRCVFREMMETASPTSPAFAAMREPALHATGEASAASASDYGPLGSEITPVSPIEKLASMPILDISDGLRQLEEKKKMQNAQLDALSHQMGTLKGISVDIGNEIDNQLKMLQIVDRRVEQYNKQLATLNRRLDTALQRAGGPTKLLLIVVALLALIAVGAGLYFLIKQILPLLK